MTSSSKAGDSIFWKAILLTGDTIRACACYLVGNDCSIDPWKDPLVPNVGIFKPNILIDSEVNNCLVKHFIISQGIWDVGKLNSHFAPADIQMILQITLPL